MSSTHPGVGRVQRQDDGREPQRACDLEDAAALRPEQEPGVRGGGGACPAGHLRALQGLPPGAGLGAGPHGQRYALTHATVTPTN